MNWLNCKIEVPHLTSFAARVAVRPPEVSADNCDLKNAIAEIRGPVCSLARTIPITTKLSWHDGENAFVGEIVDPCDWSTQLPMQYQLKIAFSNDGEPMQRLFGFRRLRTQGHSLFWDGRRWVPRGMHRNETRLDELEEMRSAGVTLVTTNPSDELCATASEQGVILFAKLPTESSLAKQAVTRLVRHPSVAALILPEAWLAEANSLSIDAGPNETRPILLQEVSALKQEEPPQTVCDGFLLNLTDLSEELIDWPAINQFSQPVILFRRSKDSNISESRNACDQLQKETIQHGDFAGYLV